MAKILGGHGPPGPPGPPLSPSLQLCSIRLKYFTFSLLDETICYIGDELKEMHKLEEPTGFGPDVNNDPFPTLGRIFCDSEGRLNANSLLLQGTQDLSRGRALPLDLSKVIFFYSRETDFSDKNNFFYVMRFFS